MTSSIDQRRLDDGARAMALPEPETADDIRRQLSSLHDSIAAMQSLDDLGSEEDNRRAWNDMLALQERYKALKARLKEMEPQPPPPAPSPELPPEPRTPVSEPPLEGTKQALADWLVKHRAREGYYLPSVGKSPTVRQLHFPNGRVAYLFLYPNNPNAWAIAAEIGVGGLSQVEQTLHDAEVALGLVTT